MEDLEAQSRLPESSPLGAFTPGPTPTPSLQGIGSSVQATASSISLTSSEPPRTSEPKVTLGQELNSEKQVAPNAGATASPNAAHATEPGAEAKRGDPLLENDEQLFEDTPESTFWTEYLSLAEKRDRALVEGWNKSMDVLLIFAGLFSAIVTAFLIEAYKGLSEDNTATNNTLLRQISASMGNAQPEGSLEVIPFKASPGIVRVNCMWFASLIISLSATVVIVLSKQWIDDYDDYQKYPGSSRERGRIRQSRYTSLLQWGIPTIIESLPTLLLIALGLFFIGLVDFLWAIDVTVAIVSMVFISLITAFFITTTLLPMFSPRCAYKAPISSFFLMLRLAAPLYSKYIYCLSRYVIPWLQYLLSRSTRDELEDKLQEARGALKSSSDALSRFHFISGWRTVIRKAEQEYVTSTVEIIDARAIAWLMESSTNDVHIHAAIRATAGLALTEEQSRVLENVGADAIVVSCIEALDAHHQGNWEKVNTDDAMAMVAGKRYTDLLNGGGGLIGGLSEHTDKNVACLYLCAYSRSSLRFGYTTATPLHWSELIFQEHGATLRKRVLITFFDTLKDQMLDDMRTRDANFDNDTYMYDLGAKTVNATLSLLEQRVRASQAWRDAPDDISQAILLTWQCQPSMALAVQAMPPLTKDWSSYARAAMGALAVFLTPRSGNERCIAASNLIDAFSQDDLLPKKDYSLTLIHASLTEGLVSVERSRQAWSHIMRALYRMLFVGVRSPFGDGPDFALACARRISQTPENAYEILTLAREPFWDALSKCCQEGTARELRGIGQSLITRRCRRSRGELQHDYNILDSSFLSTLGARIDSLYHASNSNFDGEDFLVLISFTDLSARLYINEYSRSKVIDSGIVSSLVHAWETLTRARGQAWLDERILFWQIHEPALWKGDTDEARLGSLMDRCRATASSPLLRRPDADELLSAAQLTHPESK